MLDAAWLAGFLDGEGSIMLHGRANSYAMRLTATNTHRTTLDNIAEIAGVGAIVWRPIPRYPGRSRPIGWWLANGEAAESVLRQVQPYMRTKRAQADLAISFQERLRNPALKSDRSWQLEYVERMRAMNRRGPALRS